MSEFEKKVDASFHRLVNAFEDAVVTVDRNTPNKPGLRKSLELADAAKQALLDEHRNLREELAFRMQELTEVRELYHVRVGRYGLLEKERDELKAAIRETPHQYGGGYCNFDGPSKPISPDACTAENCIWVRMYDENKRTDDMD